MESALLMTGLTVGGILVFPFAMEWFRKFQVAVVLTAGLLVAIYALAPYNGTARTLAITLNHIPETLIAAVSTGQSGIAHLNSSYFNAFHG